MIELFVGTNETVRYIRVSVINWVSVTHGHPVYNGHPYITYTCRLTEDKMELSEFHFIFSKPACLRYARKPLYKIRRPNNLSLEIKLVHEETMTTQSIDKGRAQRAFSTQAATSLQLATT